VQDKSGSYRVVYDDDLDTWSVVRTPVNGIYYAGTKAQCKRFVAHHDKNFTIEENRGPSFNCFSPLGMSTFPEFPTAVGCAPAST
jgi:hypothetical protein